LANRSNDARVVADTFAFTDVRKLYDLDREIIVQALRDFSDEAVALDRVLTKVDVANKLGLEIKLSQS
jgi:hypothetical protein